MTSTTLNVYALGGHVEATAVFDDDPLPCHVACSTDCTPPQRRPKHSPAKVRRESVPRGSADPKCPLAGLARTADMHALRRPHDWRSGRLLWVHSLALAVGTEAAWINAQAILPICTSAADSWLGSQQTGATYSLGTSPLDGVECRFDVVGAENDELVDEVQAAAPCIGVRVLGVHAQD